MKTTTFAMLAFFITTCLWFSEAQRYKLKLSDLKHVLHANDSLLIETSERSLRYQLICYELNEITDKYQSSKREKLSRKKLIDLMADAN